MSDYTVPSYNRRLSAFFLDGGLLVLLCHPAVVILAIFEVIVSKPRILENIPTPLLILSILVVATVANGYFLFRDGMKKGSFGKRKMGLMVIDEKTNRPCSYGKSFLRNLFLLMFLRADGILFRWTKDRRRLSDMIAGTRVINSEEFINLNNN
ncbi:RDD family protein [Patescibacteria group bacterium]|nr:RDD family protein [Patescibacteria group bacterium]